MGASASDKRWASNKLNERKLSADYGRNSRGGHREWSHQYKEKEEGRRSVNAWLRIVFENRRTWLHPTNVELWVSS